MADENGLASSTSGDRSIFWGWMLILFATMGLMAAWGWQYDSLPEASKGAASNERESPSPFAPWTIGGATIIANAALAPDGTNTATKLIEDNTLGTRYLLANISNVDPTIPVIVSVYAHAGAGRRMLFYLEDNGDFIVRCDIDLTSGQTTIKADDLTATTCSSVADNEGWWRIEMRGEFHQASDRGTKHLGITLTNEPFGRSYQGDGNSYILIWGSGLSQLNAESPSTAKGQSGR